MLLLVLILVLIAFGLLVVALLSGSVLWAWVSVVVSVAAAGVLLADWQQRRSAVRAGAESGEQEPESAAGPPTRYADVEPATEVIPVVGGSAAAGGGATSIFDARDDTQDTVVMPAVQPSGSPDRPSGADDPATPSGGFSSLSVADSASEDRSAESGDPDAAPPDTVATAPAEHDGERDGDAADAATSASTATADGASREEPPVAGRNERGDAEATVVVPAAAAEPVEGAPAGVAQAPPLGPDGEPPEETRDPTTAAIVAGLEDEVVVVDEKPRYHVSTCRSLLGRPIIPLPASEAVELGFTPCGWCRPDHTLSSRHGAGVR